MTFILNNLGFFGVIAMFTLLYFSKEENEKLSFFTLLLFGSFAFSGAYIFFDALGKALL